MDFLPSSPSSFSSSALGEADNEGPPKRQAEVKTLRVNMNLINIDHHCVGAVTASQTLAPKTSMDDCVFHKQFKNKCSPIQSSLTHLTIILAKSISIKE